MTSQIRTSLSKLYLFAIIALFLAFGLHHLTQFETADEHYWLYERIPQYWQAVHDGNWKKTYINDKPGISVALISGIGLFFEPHPETLCSRTSDLIETCDTTRTQTLLLVFRAPILLTNALLLLYLFWIIKKISNEKIALWSVFFMALSPILIGMSQIVNPDALLWSFGIASLFSYFATLHFREKKYVLLSGIFLGFALLSKYTAGILIPFFLLVSFLSAVFSTSNTDADAKATLKKNVSAFFLTCLGAIAIILLFLPAIWTKPFILQYLLSGGSEQPVILLSLSAFIFLYADTALFKGKSFLFLRTIVQKIYTFPYIRLILPWSILLFFFVLLIGRVFFPEWNLFERIPFDLRDLTSDPRNFGRTPQFLESLLLEFNPLVFSITPVVLLFGIITLFHTPRHNQKHIGLDFEVSMLSMFTILFLLMLIVFDVLATPRYLIILYPIFAFLAAVGICKSSVLYAKIAHFNLHGFDLKKFLFTSSIVFFSFGSAFLSMPFYFNYANFLLPKTALVSDTWGYGGYEAAQYLNTLPNAQNLLVWTDYEGVCEFFKGKCLTKQYKYPNTVPIDYAVLTRRGSILYNPNHSRWTKEGNLFMKPAYDDPNPQWRLDINGQPENFIKVVKMKSDT
jgi:4-amino-4-deoxy-L-arabinose transferase-like glycosyltransferase